MFPLDLANLFMVGADGKSRNFKRAPQLGNVIHLMIQNGPSNSRSGGSAGHLGESRRAHRLEHNGVRTRRSRLNEFQQLLALGHCVVAGVDDFYIHVQAPRGGFGGRRLLLLIVVVVVGE